MDIDLYGDINEKIRNGDRNAFNAFFRAHYAPMVNFCVRIVCDEDVAEDIVQQSFVRLWEKKEDIVVTVSLKAYLARMVRNAAINYLSRERERHKNNVDSDEIGSILDTGPYNILLGSEIESRLEESLSSMPEKRREVFMLSRYDGLKNKEIAERLNISIKTVEGHMTKALETIRTALEEYSAVWSLLIVCLSVLVK